MPSFQFAPSPRKRTVGRFITRVRRELQKAFVEEKKSRGITQAELARSLGVDRAVVCRQLAGSSNLTLRTIADYAWALHRDLVFAMSKPVIATGANHQSNPSDVGTPPIRKNAPGDPQPIDDKPSTEVRMAAAA